MTSHNFQLFTRHQSLKGSFPLELICFLTRSTVQTQFKLGLLTSHSGMPNEIKKKMIMPFNVADISYLNIPWQLKLLTISRRWQKGMYAVSIRCFVSFVELRTRFAWWKPRHLGILSYCHVMILNPFHKNPSSLEMLAAIFVSTIKEQSFAFVNFLVRWDLFFSFFVFVVVVVFCFRLTHQWQPEFLTILLQFVDNYCLIMLMNEIMYQKMTSTVNKLSQKMHELNGALRFNRSYSNDNVQIRCRIKSVNCNVQN